MKFNAVLGFSLLKGEIGNAMTTSLLVTGASAAISAFLFSQSLSTDQAAKIPRIKSAMNQVEISLRAMILQPGTFTCTQAGATADANCKINLAFLASLERELPGADSGAGGRCKIAIMDSGIGVAGNTTVNGSPFVATLKYICASDSAESKIAAQKISVDIPGEVTTVSADTFTCADIDINKPILVGFNSSSGAGTGGIKCAALKNATCPANQFVSAIDYKTMKVTCSQISSTAVAAGASEMLGGLTWTGDTFTQTSLTRKNPSAYPAVGPMFTMISSKNTSLVGKPAAVPSGGSCVCDVPKTTCWNGDQVCSPAGEACTPAPVSPAPSVAASVAPSTAPSVAASVDASLAPSVAASVAPSVAASVAASVASSVIPVQNSPSRWRPWVFSWVDGSFGGGGSMNQFYCKRDDGMLSDTNHNFETMDPDVHLLNLFSSDPRNNPEFINLNYPGWEWNPMLPALIQQRDSMCKF